MADLTSSIKIILSGAPDASAGLRDVGDSMGSLGERATGIVEAMAGATAGVLKFEAGIISTGAAVVGFSIGAADKFDASFREIATLTDQTVDGLSDFRQAILDYASGSTQSLENITGAVYNAISAGVKCRCRAMLSKLNEPITCPWLIRGTIKIERMPSEHITSRTFSIRASCCASETSCGVSLTSMSCINV